MSKSSKWIIGIGLAVVAYLFLVRPRLGTTTPRPATNRTWWQSLLAVPAVGNAIGTGLDRVVNIGRTYGPTVPADTGQTYDVIAGAQYANEYGAGD